PTGTGTGGPGYTINDEYLLSDLSFDREGLLSMAHTDAPNSAGSQFFITYGPTPNLNGAFTIFGDVTSGMEAIRTLRPRDPQMNPGAAPGSILFTVIVREVG
ncbi:MAG: peptidylprolyl isomerase, partial [Anaerolineae bacterium]|nr:peptidylprolyl isomerase [Anaerolineae bacterium]